ncbi:minor capsid protein [Paenarthrobacter nicotinovorans]|uniref:phage tail terminator protein n=1 Tax=Paenarthrobacter nicotinovorans TaxID=29320 RepID=UPI00381A1B8D
MSYVKDLLTGIAELIADSSIAVYKPNGVYGAAETGIVFGVWPQSPDRCVVLNYTPVNLATMIPMERGILEVHVRGAQGDPFGASDTAAAVRDLLQGMTAKPLGSSNIIQVLHNNSVPLVQDANRRFEHVETFILDVDTPPTQYRTD